jgi:hypothetical protein
MPETIKSAELQCVLELLQQRAKDNEAAGGRAKGYAFHRLHGQAHAYREAAQLISDTLKGVSWIGIRETLRHNAK